MDKYQTLRVFREVAERSSFSHSATALGMQNASVTVAIQDLEKSLGVRLLHRTTRRVSLTPEGELFFERCKQMLDDFESAEAMFRKGTEKPKGRVRLDMSAAAAEHIVIPLLPEFMAMHPEIEIELSSFDYKVDLLKEGIDCVLRGAGTSADAELIEKDVGEVRFVNCASPEYLETHGRPRSLEDLKSHRLINYTSTFSGKARGFGYQDNERYRSVKMPIALSVNSTSSYTAACVAGLGLAQIPIPGVRELLKNGRLVEVLPESKPEPYRLQMVYHERRRLSQRVRVLMAWLETKVRGVLD